MKSRPVISVGSYFGNPLSNLQKLYTACDIALGLLLTRCPSLTIKEYPVEVKLPRSLFAAAPASFRNPDFAQLLDTSENEPIDQISLANSDRPADAPGKPRIQFTPVKNGRALKEGLIPLQLLKDKASNPTGDRYVFYETIVCLLYKLGVSTREPTFY